MIGRPIHLLCTRLAQDDRGSIAPLIPVILLSLFILGGLIVDGSRDLDARGNAQAYAEEAARAGAAAVDLTKSTLEIDRTQAATQVAKYCQQIVTNQSIQVDSCGLDPAHPFTEATTCQGLRSDIVVNTLVKAHIDTTLLGIVGASRLGVTGYGKARPYEGTTADNAC